jgi:hypothetical protein
MPGSNSVVSVACVRLAEAVAVCDLDGVDAGGVQGTADRGEVVGPVLVPNGVHSVTQCYVLYVEAVGR